MITLRFSGAIASAVAGEITRLSQHPEFHQSEGVAYKAAWDRLADEAKAPRSPVPGLCGDFARDAAAMEAGVRFGRRALAVILMQRGELPAARDRATCCRLWDTP